MKRLLMLGWAAVALGAGAVEDGFVSLFDGKTLDGWAVNGGAAEFTVTNGVIRGVCVPGTPVNTFLCTKRDYTNFVFRAAFKIEGGNSGIQFRSYVRPHKTARHGNLVKGYQSEIRVRGDKCGCIYDECGGRKFFCNTPDERWQEMQKTFKVRDWNEMEIRSEGESIRTFVNGLPIADFSDGKEKAGFFGLQIHAQKDPKSRPGVCSWRDIRVKELPSR